MGTNYSQGSTFLSANLSPRFVLLDSWQQRAAPTSASVTLTATSPSSAAPPIVSDKNLNDTSLISGKPCGPPCFQDITLGQTSFSTAIALLKQNPLFSDVQSQANPPEADWATAD